MKFESRKTSFVKTAFIVPVWLVAIAIVVGRASYPDPTIELLKSYGEPTWVNVLHSGFHTLGYTAFYMVVAGVFVCFLAVVLEGALILLSPLRGIVFRRRQSGTKPASVSAPAPASARSGVIAGN